MSWPSIWQTQTQAQSAGAQPPVAPTMGAYGMTAEQQYALQQQNWQQWQIYQTQLAQWQAQYGEQNKLLGGTGTLPATAVSTAMPGIPNYMQTMAPPPPPIDSQPPPPPPPQQPTLETTKTHYSAPPIPNSVQNQTVNENLSSNFYQSNEMAGIMQTSSDGTMETTSNKNANFEQFSNKSTQGVFDEPNYSQQQHFSQQSPDGFRRNNRNSRWGGGNSSNNSNNRNNRMYGGNSFGNRDRHEHGANNFGNRDHGGSNFANSNRDEHGYAANNFGSRDHGLTHFTNSNRDEHGEDDDYDNEEKSQEEIAFNIHYRKWEDSFMEWKRNNANHPDQSQYNDFVVKMEGCRKKLLQKREALRQKRINSQNESQTVNANESAVQNEAPKKQDEPETVATSQPTSTTEIVQESSSSNLFANRSDDNAGIPGLDLVTDESKPKLDQNIVAQVNNILGNPEIQSLLSNIQKQQSEPAQFKPQDIQQNSNEGDSQPGPNPFNFSSNMSRLEMNENIDSAQRNPFRSNNRGYDQSQQYTNEYEENPKRGRYWNENTSNNFPPVDRMDRGRGNFNQQPPPNQDFHPAADRFSNNRKRFRELNTFNAPNDNFNAPNCEEFRPMQIIDYQNRPQAQPLFGNEQNFPGSFASSNTQSNEFFQRKVIEYDHKSKVHPWNWFCPVIQIDNNHTKVGLLLHEYPPPKEIEKTQPPQWSRQPKWPQGDRQERFAPYGGASNQHHFQSRYDNRQNIPSQQVGDGRRLPPEKSWIRNHRDPAGIPRNDRFTEPKNIQKKNDINTQQSSTFPAYHNPNANATERKLEPNPNPKFNLKNLLFPPGRMTRPNKFVILMRGIPGSGKSYTAKLIKDKEQEMGGSARILSIDDYFMTETDDENQRQSSEQLSYEFDRGMEETYTQYLIKSFKKTLLDNLFNCVIVDSKNTTLQHLTEFYNVAKAHFFTPFICELPLDIDKCLKNNIHNRTEEDIRDAMKEWMPTPQSYTLLDYECLFNSADNTVEISDAEDEQDDSDEVLDAITDDENMNAENDLDDLSGWAFGSYVRVNTERPTKNIINRHR